MFPPIFSAFKIQDYHNWIMMLHESDLRRQMMGQGFGGYSVIVGLVAAHWRVLRIFAKNIFSMCPSTRKAGLGILQDSGHVHAPQPNACLVYGIGDLFNSSGPARFRFPGVVGYHNNLRRIGGIEQGFAMSR